MSTAAASASSRSAGLWACRRPPTTSAPPASARPRPVEDERLLGASASCTPPTTTPTATGALEGAAARRRADVGRDRVKRLMRAHGIQGAKRRGKPWRTTIADPAATRGARPRRARLHRRAAGRAVGGGLHLPALLGGPGVLQLRHRRLSAGAIVGWQFASHMRTDLVLDALRMALDPPPARRRRRAHPSLRCRLAIHELRLPAGPRRPPGARRRSARSATPTTTRWPRASSTPSRPS